MAELNADLRKGCRVRLSGLTSTLLNGAEGCVVGHLDEETGRHPVKLLKPSEAVAAYPNGVKVKPANLERVQEVSSVARPTRKERKPKTEPTPSRAGGPRMDPAAWACGLSTDEQAEWFVDCYRMRVDDDYAWGGCNLHGLYDPEATDDTIVADFLGFCKLAVAHGVMPSQWDWAKCMAKAGELLRYAFEKSDAQEKYGGENVFSVLGGGRSLRVTGEAVYGTSCMAGGMSMDGGDGAHEMVQELVDARPFGELLSQQPDMFADVGGVVAWRRLRSALASA